MKKIKFIGVLTFGIMFSCAGESNKINEKSDVDISSALNEDSAKIATSIVQDLGNEDFKSFLSEKNGILIDVRTPEEFAVGHIENAVNINFYSDDFDAKISELDKNTPTFVYCQAGGRSGQARDLLVKKEFKEIYNLKDGFGKWAE